MRTPRYVAAPAPNAGRSADAVEPADRRTRAGVAERLELVVPRLTDGEVHLVEHASGVRGELERGADSVLRHDDVAVRVRLGVEDPQLRRVGPAAAVDAGGGVLGDLVAQVVPPAQRRGEPGTGADRTDPRVLGPEHAGRRGLRRPLQGDPAVEDRACRPLDVGAQGPRCSVHEYDAAGNGTTHVDPPGSG